MKRCRQGWILAWVVACVFPIAALAGGATNLDEHAGKPILTDDAFSPSAKTAPAAGSRSFDMDTGRVVLALSAVIGLILILRWGGKRILPPTLSAKGGGMVKVLARCPLAPKQQVVLLQVGKRIIVAADCNSQLSSLCQITDADEVAALIGEVRRTATSPASHPFSSWFSRANDEFGESDAVEADDAEPRGKNLDIASDEPIARAFGEEQRSELGSLSAKVRDLVRQFSPQNNSSTKVTKGHE